MSAIIENTAYRLRVRSDNGRILTAQRAYLSQGITLTGKRFFRNMRWIAFVWMGNGHRTSYPGIPSELPTKAELLQAILKHPDFNGVKNEL